MPDVEHQEKLASSWA